VLLSARMVAAVGALGIVAGLTVWGFSSFPGATTSAAYSQATVSPTPTPSSPTHRTSASPSPGPQPGADQKWKLKFASNFSGAGLDTTIWGTCYPWADPAKGCTNFHGGEYEWYVRSQVRVSGGLLHLAAQRKPTQGLTKDGRPTVYACRSGMVTTYPSFNFKYGVVQIVARMPSVKGMWPALWLAASNLKWPPEIDILEHWVRPERSTGLFLHPLDRARVGTFPLTANLARGWHTFSLVWTQRSLEWFIDGRLGLYSTHQVPRQPMYFIANLADAKRPSRGGCGGSLVIRSVKVWQKRQLFSGDAGALSAVAFDRLIDDLRSHWAPSRATGRCGPAGGLRPGHPDSQRMPRRGFQVCYDLDRSCLLAQK
jgi:beta-glucanase (GH16 family)